MAESSTRPYHHGDLRASLVAAGTALLREKGLEALTLRAIAARAGVSHSAPYNHFADRRAMLAAITADSFRRLTAAMQAVREGDAAEALRRICYAYLRFALDHPAEYRLMFVSDILVGKLDPEIGAMSKACFDLLAEVVARYLPAHAKPGAVSVVAWSHLHGLALLVSERRVRSWMRDGVDDAALIAATAAGMPAEVTAAAAAI